MSSLVQLQDTQIKTSIKKSRKEVAPQQLC